LQSANDLDKEIFGFEPVEDKKPVLSAEAKKVNFHPNSCLRIISI
jgi:hypothetical protein